MSENSFDARADLEVGGRSFEIFRLDALQKRFDVARLPYSLKVLLENLLRNEDGVGVSAPDIEALASWDAKAEPSQEIAFTPARVLMQDFTGVPAVVDLAAMRDAMAATGRRSRADQPARAGRARHRPLRPGRRVRHARGVREERRARVRAQPGALRLPALGPGRLRGLPRRAARHRHRPPGQPRVPRARGLHQRRAAGRERPGAGLSRHAGRHRLAHDDGQRPGRARLGRRRHRGRGGDARPADVDADPAGARLQARGRVARGCDRDRPRADRHRDAARARRGGHVRGVLRRRRLGPADRRPGDHRQHVARVRLDLRDLPDRRRDAALPGVLGPPGRAHRADRGLRARAGPVARRARRGADLLRHDHARPGRGRPVAGRPEAPAGPRLADRGQGVLPDRPGGLPARRGRGADRGGGRSGRGARRHVPGLRSAVERRAVQRQRGARSRCSAARRGARHGWPAGGRAHRTWRRP